MENQRKSGENEMQLKTGCEQQDAGPMEQYPQDTVHFATHCQFRNAKANFAMPKPISQCQFQFRNANTLFICPNLCEISHCEIHNPLCEFRKPISHCEIHCLCEIHIRKPIFALPNSLHLRNSHLQALSSSPINATDFQTW